MQRLLLYLALLVLAIVCYAIGMEHSLLIMIILGMGFELAFWVGVLGKKSKRKIT